MAVICLLFISRVDISSDGGTRGIYFDEICGAKRIHSRGPSVHVKQQKSDSVYGLCKTTLHIYMDKYQVYIHYKMCCSYLLVLSLLSFFMIFTNKQTPKFELPQIKSFSGIVPSLRANNS